MKKTTLAGGRAALAFLFVTAVLDIMAMGIVIPVLPMLIEEFAGSNARAGLLNGLLVALWAMMQFVASPVMGSLSDRFGRRPVLLLSAAGLGSAYVLVGLSPNLWWLAAARMISGITSSSMTTAYAYMADITPMEGRARAYGLLGAAFSGGFVAGPLLGGVLGEFSPRAPFWVAAALSGASFLYGMFVLPESLAKERRMAFSWRRANPIGAMLLLRSHSELLGLAGVNFLVNFAHYVFSAVFVLYAGFRYEWSPLELGLLLTLVGVLDVIVQGVLVGPVAKKLGDGRTMILGLVCGAFGIAAMGLAPTGIWFAVAMLPHALGGLANPAVQSLMTQRVSGSEQGQLQGANMSVASVAGIFSPLFFGAVYSASVGEGAWLPHPGTAFLIAAMVLLAAAVVAWSVARRAERGEKGEGEAVSALR